MNVHVVHVQCIRVW